jgi:hypothetical protein
MFLGEPAVFLEAEGAEGRQGGSEPVFGEESARIPRRRGKELG